MSKKLVLEVTSRDLSKEKSNHTRKEGFLPAVVYGAGQESKSLKVSLSVFDKVLNQAGMTDLIDLVIDGAAPIKVLVHDVQRDIKDRILHVDFLKVDMAKELVVSIPLHFVGEAKAVKDLGGTLIKAIDELEVECLPDALVHGIDVDLSPLVEIGDHLTVGDIKLPAGMKITGNLDDMVVSVVESGSQSTEEPVAVAPVATEEKTEEKK